MPGVKKNLREQLIDAQATLLSIISQGPDALATFSNSWSSLCTSLENSFNEGKLESETSAIAQEVATEVHIIASEVMKLHEEAELVRACLADDLDQIFSKVNITEEQEPNHSGGPRSNLHELPSTSSQPPYLETAYSWLLENVYNPYPSRQVKCLIARNAGTSTKDVDRWFATTRKRIGWNALKARYFSNKRKLIVQAAKHCMLRSDGKCNLGGPDFKIEPTWFAEFITIENNVKSLYLGKFPEIPAVTVCNYKLEPMLPRSQMWRDGSIASSSDGSPSPRLQARHLSSRKRRSRLSDDEDEADCRPQKRHRPTADSEVPVSLTLTISGNNEDSSEAGAPPASQSSPGTTLNKRKSHSENDDCATLARHSHTSLSPPPDFGGQGAIFENPIGGHWPSTHHGFNFDTNVDSCTIDTLDLDTTDVIVDYYQFDSFPDTTDLYLGTCDEATQVGLTNEYDWNILLASNDQLSGQYWGPAICASDKDSKSLSIDCPSLAEIESLHFDIPPPSHFPFGELFPDFDDTSIYQGNCKRDHLQVFRNEFRLFEADIFV